MSGVVGGALVPHAPQFFSLPDTEDKATIVHATLGEVGRYLADPVGYCAASGITKDEQDALAAMDRPKRLTLGIHPLVSFLAHLQVERERKPH